MPNLIHQVNDTPLSIELIEPSQELCVTVTTFCNFKYEWLPTGLTYTPDLEQQVMEVVLHDVEENGIFLDYIDAS